MIVICEECGKKYRVDPSKIKGKAANFTCRVCRHVIKVRKPEETPPAPVETDIAHPPPGRGAEHAAAEGATVLIEDSPPSEETMAKAVRRRKTRFGVRARMLLLFLLLPLLLMGAAGFLYIRQMDKLSELLTDESSNVVNQMAEEKIADLSSAVAMQCKLYLMSHPDLSKQDFSTDMGFKSLAVQKVGLTGYTALYELPGEDGVWRTWAHVNPQIIGIDMELLRESMGSNFAGFWRIYTDVKNGQKSKGYYTWKDKDGQFRKKFMVCTPVPGTPYVVAATTYLDEFHGPLKAIEHKSKAFTEQARMVSLGILGGTMLIIFILVSVFGHRLTSRIKHLTEVADRISVGDLDIDIDTSSRDEIGELAEAISRMQESIRLSIERLRRRR